MLRREGIFEQEKLFETPTVLSDRYKEMGMREAIEEVLKSNQPEKLSVDFIYSELIKKLKTNEDLLRLVEKIDVAGAGFINFWLKKDILLSNLIQIDEEKEKYGT